MGGDQPSDTAPESTADGGEGRRPGIFRRHKALTVLGVLLVLLLVIAAGGFFWLNSKIAAIPRSPFGEGIDPSNRPTRSVEAGDSLNILVSGVDSRESENFEALLEQGNWSVGAARSDTNMVLHIPADRSAAYLVSIPRDSYVPIHDETGADTGERHKINYAFSIYGPDGHIATMEHLTGLRMDHMMVVNWQGFIEITEALGGVTVNIPQTLTDPQTGYTWEQGPLKLEGELALKYVRTRYPLANGDFGRIYRQQNFIRAMMAKMVSAGTVTNPFKLNSTLNAVAGSLILDDAWTTGELRGLAWSMRGVRTGDVEFLTVPLADQPFATVPSDGSIVRLNDQAMDTLWAAMSRDDMESYQPENAEQVLPGPNDVQ